MDRIEEKTASTGNKYKQITFRIFGKKAEEKGVNGRLVWDNIVLLEQVEWKIQNLLYACGMPYEGEVSLSKDWDELIGKELRIYVGTREYQGAKRNDVKSFYPLTARKDKKKSKEEGKKPQAEEKGKEDINPDEVPF